MAAVGDGLDVVVTQDRPSQASTPLDRLFGAAIVACVLFSLLVLIPGVHGHAILPALDLVLDTISTVVFVALTTLAWARFRERQAVAAAYHAGAFMALSVAYASAVLVSLLRAASVGDPGALDDGQLLVFAVARLAAAILFVLAGVLPSRSTYGWKPAWILVGPALAVLLAALIGRLLDPVPDIGRFISFPDATGLPHATPTGAVLDLAVAVLFYVGAYVSRGLWRSGAR